MPYRKPGTLETCWYILKLWVLEHLRLNKDDKPKGEKEEGNHD